MAVSNPPVGLDHPTVVPENFEQDAESETAASEGSDDGAEDEQ